MTVGLREGSHYAYRNTVDRIAFFLDSASYYAGLADVISRARRRVLLVGWAFDDRTRLVRDEPGVQSAETRIGEMLAAAARSNPDLRVQVYVWRSPAVFSADQHISHAFRARAGGLENFEIARIPADSVFATRHEKYVIVDDRLAFLGGIDISHNRWDRAGNRSTHSARVNPDGEMYNPYHDTHVAFTGPLVRDLFSIARQDLSLKDDWNPARREIWPAGVPADAENTAAMLSLTRPEEDKRQIEAVYVDLIYSARKRIFIENQYFSSDVITAALAARLQERRGPEVLILMPRELPDALGRLTMGINASMHLYRLMEHDHEGRLGFFNALAEDDPEVNVKVHSKLMIVDGLRITLGSANISRRSFSLDYECNITLDATDAEELRHNGTIEGIEHRLMAQHTGLSLAGWEALLAMHRGSRVAAVRARSREWAGLEEGNDFLAPGTVTGEVVKIADMSEPPPQETILKRIAQTRPAEFIMRMRKTLALFVFAVALVAGIYYAARYDVDVQEVLDRVEAINRAYPVPAAVLTIVTFWLTTLTFVTIVVPIVFFAALHGSVLGAVYSLLGLISGGAIFYGIGLALHNSDRLQRFRAVRIAREQLEKIKPYGTWAVAITRMVPSGPFIVVNLVTGMLGFTPRQFLAGSFIGLAPGVIALSVFGNIVRTVFTDPSVANVAWFVLFIAGYFALLRAIVVLAKRVTGWIRDK